MSACTIFPVQPTSRIPGLFPALGELSRSARRGLGECPDYAPYAAPGGGCSNVPPEINAFEYFKAGGQLDESSQTIVGYTGSDAPTLDCPFGSKLNPFTGRTECRSDAEAKYTTGSGYVVRTSSDQGTMAAIAAAAQAEGRARGINITCKAVPLGGDLLNNNMQVYGTDCSVNGSSGHDASVLLTGSGFETLATELGISPFFKASTGYQYTPPTSQQSQSQVIRTAAAPIAPAQPPPAAPAAPVSKPATIVSKIPTTAEVISTVTDIAERAKAAVTGSGIPTWVWLAAGAGAVGLYMFGGKRR